jgi:hypothetical protein
MFYFIFSIQPKNALYGQNFSPSWVILIAILI